MTDSERELSNGPGLQPPEGYSDDVVSGWRMGRRETCEQISAAIDKQLARMVGSERSALDHVSWWESGVRDFRRAILEAAGV